ncbi:MAG: polyprenyl synthetase family protein [Acidimicrobiales bacterium]
MALPSDLLVLPGMADELERVAAALKSSVVTDDPYFSELTTHLVDAGGKLLRPALTVAAGAVADPGGRVSDEVVRGGAAVELVQIGSLYHDDVMDEALTRRSVESVNARWGNLRAILAGDFLLAKASEIAASLGTEVAGLLAATIGRMCEGQVRELQTTFDVSRTEEQYTAAIEGKTASLFAAAARIGGLVVELPRAHVEALTTFGRRYGMAFQVVDDILDVVATDEQLGKPAGNDLAEGVYTFPVIRALASPAVGGELAELLGHPLTPDEVDRARKLVRTGDAIESATALGRSYCVDAVRALDALPDNAAVDHLRGMATGLLDHIPS